MTGRGSSFWTHVERRFADPEVRERVALERRAAEFVLDNESKERILVGEAYAIVAGAGQLAREISVSDHGLDMEVEFKDDLGQATGRRVFLQLKSGDSHLRHRKRDEARVFRLDPRHADYWVEQPHPVYLVIRDSAGYIEAMDVRAELSRLRSTTTWPPTELRFVGEQFDVMCVRRWRQSALELPQP